MNYYKEYRRIKVIPIYYMLPMGLSLGVYKKQSKSPFVIQSFDFKEEQKIWHKVMGLEKVPTQSKRKKARKTSTRQSKNKTD